MFRTKPYNNGGALYEKFFSTSSMIKPSLSAFGGSRTSRNLIVFVCVIGAGIMFYNIYFHYFYQHNSDAPFRRNRFERQALWLYAEKSSHLTHVVNVFEQAGYAVRTSLKRPDRWDVMWAYDFPFGRNFNLKNLQPGQRVNHLPGTGYLTLKVHLAKSKLRWVPQAFTMPTERQEFQASAGKYPDKLWIQKGNNHRGIKILKTEDLDLTAKNTFMQEFVDKPLLVDGKKFDIGIYIVITSVEPLMVYIYSQEILVRFCTEDYYPFNSENVKSYVVGDDYTPLSDMPSLKDYYNLDRLTFKDSLFTYLRSKGHNTEKLWDEIKTCIAEMMISKEGDFMKSFKGYVRKENFFEMVRVDFVIDQNTNLWLMEVNMSPNLSSGAHTMNALMYEKVIYGTLSLVGIMGRHLSSDMLANERDITIADAKCRDAQCNNCNEQCALCHHCLSDEVKVYLKKAHSEHHKRGAFIRVLPPTSPNTKGVKGEVLNDMRYAAKGKHNTVLSRWFQLKCDKNAYWCT